MNININDLKLQIKFSAAGIEEIMQNIKTLFTTPVGTVPFDRDFGIDFSILDLPVLQAKAKLTIEYIEKVKKYEPRVRVTEVTFEANQEGTLNPKVVIDLVGNG